MKIIRGCLCYLVHAYIHICLRVEVEVLLACTIDILHQSMQRTALFQYEQMFIHSVLFSYNSSLGARQWIPREKASSHLLGSGYVYVYV